MRIAVAALALCVSACSSAPEDPCVAVGVSAEARFATGSADGHLDPTGAKAAGQARAGRVRDASMIKQAANAKQKVNVGDYLLANDKIAVYVEAAGKSDAYQPFGGEILAIEPVGADGKPTGISQYGETLVGLSRQAIDAESVTVLADGSDGKDAIVRVSGRFRNIPFLDVFEPASPDEFDFPAALDYVLSPGQEKVTLRLSFMNVKNAPIDLSTNQNVGFFHSMRNQMFVEKTGFAGGLTGRYPWVGFDGGQSAFIFRLKNGALNYFIDVSGFTLFQGTGLAAQACEQKSLDYAEVIVGAPGIDGAVAALHRLDGDVALRELKGTVVGVGGAPLAGGWVHAQSPDGAYLTRALSDANGAYLLHVPPSAVTLTPTLAGYAVPAATPVAAGANDVPLQLGAMGSLHVTAKDKGSSAALPVRVQVIPSAALTDPPASFGVRSEAGGRLYQDFAVSGDSRLLVPPGSHRVIISRGFEWELLDQMATVTAGQTTQVDAVLEHGVDSTGVMCADFHIHSYFSADSNDDVDYKVRGAIADGLEIPVSSEHEWIFDFQPLIEKLGVTQWAFSLPSEEFTTFTWGHFGIIPINPRPGTFNNGAIDWVGKKAPEVFKNIKNLPEDPVLIINHPSGGGFGAYFSAAHLNRTTAKGDPDMWSDQFEAVEAFNGSDFDANRDAIVADWFALLDSGKKVVAVGSSDSHHLRGSPVGYPRTCLRFGHDDPKQLSAEKVRDALRSGKATVSGGLYMTVAGPGGIGPGETVAAGAGALDFKVVVQAPSWLAAQTLEVLVDGKTAQSIELQESVTAGPARRWEATVTVTPPATGTTHYVVFHAKSAKGVDLSPVNPGNRPFAVSNPIFF